MQAAHHTCSTQSLGKSGSPYPFMQDERCSFDIGFVPISGIDKRLQRNGSTLNQQRSNALIIKRFQQLWNHRSGEIEHRAAHCPGRCRQRHRVGRRNFGRQPVGEQGRRRRKVDVRTKNDAQRRASARPQAQGKRRIVAMQSTRAHQYGVAPGPETMHEKRRLLVGKTTGRLIGSATAVDKTIGTLGPLQDDIRALLFMGRHKSDVQCPTLFVEDSCNDLDAGITQQSNTPSETLGNGSRAPYNNTGYLLLDNQEAARRGLPVIGAGFERDI